MKEQSSANLGLEALPACDMTRAAEKISGMKMHCFFNGQLKVIVKKILFCGATL